MRFAISPRSRRLHDLVVALDREQQPIAETWRAVGESATKLGMLRPGDHAVRRARKETQRAALDALGSLTSGYLLHHKQALQRLNDAATRERQVLKQHKPP